MIQTHQRPVGQARAGDPRRPGPAEGVRIDRIRASAYRIPTDQPESDGTLAWDHTTLVVAEASAAGTTGLGYTYADAAAARLIAEVLADRVVGRSAFEIPAMWLAMVGTVRNIGLPGIGATAVSALDTALWDLKARLLDLSLADLLGTVRDRTMAYGSGGFTSYSDRQLVDQLGAWAADGFGAVKMKVGREPGRDPDRVAAARRAIGPQTRLFVDANGAYDRRTAVGMASAFDDGGVEWFEEPVSSDDIAGLRFVREHVPAGIAVAAGEYAWRADDLRGLLVGEAVDVLQADGTRCLGTTGFMAAAALAEAFHVPLSAHCAPSLHTTLMAAARPGIHLEWFHDHVRLEQMLFDGAPAAVDGMVGPDLSAPGLGLALKADDAAGFLVWRTP